MNNAPWNRRGRGWDKNRSNPGRGTFRSVNYQTRDRDRWQGRGGAFGRNSDNRKQFHPAERQNRYSEPGERLTEKDIGVTEYVSTLKGISGIIKSRYGDFHVNEIDLDGHVAKLTDKEVPVLPTVDAIDDDEVLAKYDVELLPSEMWDKLFFLASTDERNPEKVQIDVTGMSKEERGAIYDAVKNAFGKSIYGCTSDDNDKKYVVFAKYNKGDLIDQREKWLWPGLYVHFLLYKENCTTAEAITQISDALRLPNVHSSYFGFSGTKDRRAITTQWCSLRKIAPLKIRNACKRFRHIHVGNYRFSDNNLKLGDLKGNRFRIALRNVTSSEEDIAAGMEHLKDKGFINYYGLQRFGNNREVPTYLVGKKLLQGEFKEATELLLTPRRGPLYAALDTYKRSKSASQAIGFLDKYLKNSLEGKLLQGLDRTKGNDYMTALFKIQRGTRTLYMHSYQSLIWNKCVTERIKRFGMEVAVGDLVLADKTVSDLEEIEMITEQALDEKDDLDTDDIEISLSEDNYEKDEPDDIKLKKQNGDQIKKEDKVRPKINVKSVTEEDLQSKRYNIFDIIMPLPGFAVEYPTNIKDFYEELLKTDNLDVNLKQKSKSFSLSGAYRLLFTRPKELSWHCVKYTNHYSDLIVSDIKQLLGQETTAPEESGKYTALIMELTLPACTYATMFLRELLKTDTSCEYQALGNDYHKEQEVSTDKDANSENVPTSTEDSTDTPEAAMNPEEKSEKRKIEEVSVGDTPDADDSKKAKK